MQGGWFRGLDLEQPPAAFVRRPCGPSSSWGSSNQQQQHCPSSCRSWQLPPTSSPRRSSSPPGRSPASAPEPAPAPSWPTRVPLSTFGWVPPSSVSIHHFWIQLKVTELNRMESRTLPKTTSPPKWIIFYWRIQDCFLEQKQLFNHVSALFQINFQSF